LALGSVGVVYGDIVTSPLYALKESLAAAAAGGALTASPRQPERTSAAIRQR
jgi:KUP system potassium uptake protein